MLPEVRAGRRADAARGTLQAALHADRYCEQWRPVLQAPSADRRAAKGASARAKAIAICRSADDMWRAGGPDGRVGRRVHVQSATRPGAFVITYGVAFHVLSSSHLKSTIIVLRKRQIKYTVVFLLYEHSPASKLLILTIYLKNIFTPVNARALHIIRVSAGQP